MSDQKPLIGVVGGGQLAMMLIEAGIKRNIEFFVQTESKEDPAINLTTNYVLDKTDSLEGTKELITKCNCITFENEWLDIHQLLKIKKQDVRFIPSLESLAPLINKISQRQLINRLGIPGPNWIELSSVVKNHRILPKEWNYPVMAKTSKGGYDGKGTKVINDSKELNDLISNNNKDNWFLESWVNYERELALVASRDSKGRIRTFPLTETFQVNQICDWVFAPADVVRDVQLMAYNVASSILVELNYVGVIAIEFFYGSSGLIVNEIAPRTHNSAHYSIEACTSSQFDQQVCIAADIPLEEPNMLFNGAVMINLLGLPAHNKLPLEERLKKIKNIKDAHLHWYGKSIEMPGRKLGHLTVQLWSTQIDERLKEAKRIHKKIRAIWPLPE